MPEDDRSPPLAEAELPPRRQPATTFEILPRDDSYRVSYDLDRMEETKRLQNDEEVEDDDEE